MSFGRSAIEPNTQDRITDALDVLIDAGRDCLESVLANDKRPGFTFLDIWSESDVPLLRRLAVHGWGLRTDVGATTKLAWLRSHGFLFDHQLHHEVFRLIARALPDAAKDVADALVADIAESPADEGGHSDYQRFSELAWMSRNAPNCSAPHRRLSKSGLSILSFKSDLIQTFFRGPKLELLDLSLRCRLRNSTF